MIVAMIAETQEVMSVSAARICCVSLVLKSLVGIARPAPMRAYESSSW